MKKWSIFKLTAVLAFALVAAWGGMACRKEVEVTSSAVQDAPEPRTLVLIRRDPHMDEYYVQTVDVTWWEEGRDAIIIHGAHTIIPYPWQGEDTTIYAYDGDYLWVKTKPQDTTFFIIPERYPEDYDVWEKGKAEDTLSIEFYEPPYNYWAQGRVIGLSTHRYYRMDIERPEDIVCIGDYNMLELDSLDLYPNLETIGMSYDLDCNLGFWNYVYHIVFRRNLRKIPENLDLYVEYSHPTPGLCSCKSRVLSRRKNLAGLVCYIPPWANKVLRHIGKMRNLRQLEIRYYSANDRKLRHLAKLKNLHTLTLDRIKISDRGLAHLGEIRSLRSLRLDEFQAHTVRDFRYWLKNLTVIVDHYDYYTNRFDYVRFIEEFPYQYGSLFIPPTTAEGWKYLAELPYLQELDLIGQYSYIIEITDEDLRGIGQITSLRRLRVRGENITDEGLEYLHALTNLEYLHVFAEGSTEEGYKRLKEALPNCEIDWGNKLHCN